MNDFDIWLAEVKRLLGSRFAEVSATLLQASFDLGDTPVDAVHWARVATGGTARN